MTLTIITINYNNLEGLRRTLQSVESQDRSHLEWIVVDGGSTDGSAQYIREHAALAAWWVSEPDGGVYEAMNKGLDHATGDYVQFLNSGDSLNDHGVVSDFLAISPKADLVYGDTVMVDAEGRETGMMLPPDTLSLLYFYNNNLNHQAVFFSRRCFQGRRYDLRYRLCSDRHLILSLLLQGHTHSHWQRRVARYDTTGMSSVQTERMQRESRQAMDALLPPVVARDYQTLVSLRDVPLLRQALDIVFSARPLRLMARAVLAPIHLFAKKERRL